MDCLRLRLLARSWLQVVLFVPVIYVMIGFTMVWEKAIYYAFMFLCSISFYTIFGQFMVYVTPSQQIAQVSTHFVNGMCIRLAPSGITAQRHQHHLTPNCGDWHSC